MGLQNSYVHFKARFLADESQHASTEANEMMPKHTRRVFDTQCAQQFPGLWPLYEQLNWQFAQAGFRLVRGTARIFSPLVSVDLQPTSLKIYPNLIQLKVVY